MTEDLNIKVLVKNIHRGPIFINGKYLKVGQRAKLNKSLAQSLLEKGYVEQIK